MRHRVNPQPRELGGKYLDPATVSSFLVTLRDSYLNSLHVSPIACKNLKQEQNRRMTDYINF